MGKVHNFGNPYLESARKEEEYFGDNPEHSGHYEKTSPFSKSSKKYTVAKVRVRCLCRNCGDTYYLGAEHLTAPTGQHCYLNKNKIDKACDEGTISKLKPKNAAEWAVLKMYLCINCYTKNMPKFIQKELSERAKEKIEDPQEKTTKENKPYEGYGNYLKNKYKNLFN